MHDKPGITAPLPMLRLAATHYSGAQRTMASTYCTVKSYDGPERSACPIDSEERADANDTHAYLRTAFPLVRHLA
jgi:hypothetical protein